jgi:hypothetical protein
MNVYLMKFYDEYYQSKSIESLKEFTILTFPQDGTDKLFIGCVLILITNVYRTMATAEALSTIVQAVKQKIGSSNLLQFYLERVNGNKLISKYLFKVIYDEHLDHYSDVLLGYLYKMSFHFCDVIGTGYKAKIEEYRYKQNDE